MLPLVCFGATVPALPNRLSYSHHVVPRQFTKLRPRPAPSGGPRSLAVGLERENPTSRPGRTAQQRQGKPRIGLPGGGWAPFPHGSAGTGRQNPAA